ncbi:MAG: hypothetical protein ACXWIU_09025 [Limisphaerales bacterium]
MTRKDFIPPKDAEFLPWHDNLKTQATLTGTTYGLVAGDVTAIGADNTDFHTKMTAVTTTALAAKNAVTAKNISRVTAEARARALIRRIKASAAYTPAVGDSYGINGPEDTLDLNSSAPVLTGKALVNGHAQVNFTNPKLEGVNLYCKRGAETEFTFLALDTASPYVDNRNLLVAGQPELRNYKAVYISNGVEVGSWSEVLVITCAP